MPVLVDGDLTLFESNLIISYLLSTYPDAASNPPRDPPLASSMTRPDRHWEDAKTLATIETFGNSMVSLRLMASDGFTPATSTYMARQATRVQRCLDWLEGRATPEGFAPGWFSVMDIALICPIAFGEKRGILNWRGRPTLEAIYDRLLTRPSVAATPVNDLPPKQ